MGISGQSPAFMELTDTSCIPDIHNEHGLCMTSKALLPMIEGRHGYVSFNILFTIVQALPLLNILCGPNPCIFCTAKNIHL